MFYVFLLYGIIFILNLEAEKELLLVYCAIYLELLKYMYLSNYLTLHIIKF